MTIQETTFGPKQYLTLRKKISTSQISDTAMYDEAGRKLNEYAKKNNLSMPGGWAVLYFSWDEENKQTEIGICMPVEGLSEINDSELSLTIIPETKASMAVLNGSYKGIGEVHHALMEYTVKNNLNSKINEVMAVEDYIVGPMQDSNPDNFITNIYYLHA